ncbi:MAG: hypothetical protein P1S46_00055 [bacterium]|nr:hypothetical protein [bacterium]
MSDLKKLFRKEHPFITEPGSWILAGHSMSGDPLDRVPVQGRIQITHEEGKIVNLGEMGFVSRSNPVKFQTSYELTPAEDELALDFFQANDAVGDLKGRLVAFDDRLVSSYTSGDGSLTGFEVFFRTGDNRYAVTGTLLSGGKIISLWKLDMVRPAAEEARKDSEQTGGE